ncbi:d-2-hydroxyglutarate dehydrogenase [Quercus suber]|uniref:D-2-hydroxyglutarate dehydrogenase n=1 Tax=Quercus suber TaxID=58331 RepID=A0AAW0JZY6_QUESU
MQKWRATRRLLLNSYSSKSRFDHPRSNPISDHSTTISRSSSGFESWTGRIHYRHFATAMIQRNPAFSTLNSDDINYFKGILGDKNVIEDEDTLLFANTDWMRKYKGSTVVPQGGNTGLVGGSVPVFDEVIINVGSMKQVISFDKVSGVLVCEAGCILENLVSFLDNQGFIMPLDLGAKGSCQIGGNVSTNAGGLRLVRYGSLHGTVLGIEAVLANGDVLDMLGTLRKDNTGYDLKHLFIGSEGSLGIVTKVSILTPPKLSSVNLAFLACKDYSSCQKLLFEAKRRLGEILSAFEFLDNESLNLALNHLEGVRNPLPPAMHNFYVLIETTGSDESYDKEKLEAFLLRSMEGGLISDGVIAQDINQASSFWRIREGVPEALMKAGAVYKYDLSLPVETMYNLVEEMRTKLGNSAKVIGYGHLGDGNLHLNISTPQYDDVILAQIEPFVYEWTSKQRGSISAEHGLGLMKANKIFYSKSHETVQLMASIKKLMDPNGILNPYKVLPHSIVSYS